MRVILDTVSTVSWTRRLVAAGPLTGLTSGSSSAMTRNRGEAYKKAATERRKFRLPFVYTKRLCLRCDVRFRSEGPWNRFCGRCKRLNELMEERGGV